MRAPGVLVSSEEFNDNFLSKKVLLEKIALKWNVADFIFQQKEKNYQMWLSGQTFFCQLASIFLFFNPVR